MNAIAMSTTVMLILTISLFAAGSTLIIRAFVVDILGRLDLMMTRPLGCQLCMSVWNSLFASLCWHMVNDPRRLTNWTFDGIMGTITAVVIAVAAVPLSIILLKTIQILNED